MAAPTVGPCELWTSPEEIIACNCSGLDPTTDAAVLDAATNHASQVLFGLSGRQYPGACTEKRYPCLGGNCGCGGAGWMSSRWGSWWHSGYPSIPTRVDGEWFNIGCCSGRCNERCVKLPGPINSVTQVVIDGEVLDPAAYRVRGFRRVCRVDGGSWPCTQDFSVGGTWFIEYVRGKPITTNMRAYASMLGCEFAKAICGTTSCLPENVVNIVRDGVTINFEDAEALFAQGQVGAELIDQWLRAVNPNKLARAATVVRADDPAIAPRWTT